MAAPAGTPIPVFITRVGDAVLALDNFITTGMAAGFPNEAPSQIVLAEKGSTFTAVTSRLPMAATETVKAVGEAPSKLITQ